MNESYFYHNTTELVLYNSLILLLLLLIYTESFNLSYVDICQDTHREDNNYECRTL